MNLGDAMQVWSNDHYRAAVHRPAYDTIGCSGRFAPYFLTRWQCKLESLIPAHLVSSKYSGISLEEILKGHESALVLSSADDVQIQRLALNEQVKLGQSARLGSGYRLYPVNRSGSNSWGDCLGSRSQHLISRGAPILSSTGERRTCQDVQKFGVVMFKKGNWASSAEPSIPVSRLSA